MSRKKTLLTLIELAVVSDRRECLIMGLEAHSLLTGEPIEGPWADKQLRDLYPEFIPTSVTEREAEGAALSEGKAKPICIWHEGDARAYYAATEEQRSAWNTYAQSEADRASQDLDMGEALSAYTSRDRDGKIHSWAPPLWFPEWLNSRSS